jgi:hypothetical protein
MSGLDAELLSFLTSILDGGECSAPHPSRLILRERNPSSVLIKARWAPQPVWTSRGEKPVLPLMGIKLLLGHSTRRLVTVSTTKSRLLKGIQLLTTKMSGEAENGSWTHLSDQSHETGDREFFMYYSPPETLSYLWRYSASFSCGSCRQTQGRADLNRTPILQSCSP